MKYHIKYTGQFKRDMRLCQRRGYNMELLHHVISLLAETGQLPENIGHITCAATARGNGNATYNPIGCLFGTSMTVNWNY